MWGEALSLAHDRPKCGRIADTGTCLDSGRRMGLATISKSMVGAFAAGILCAKSFPAAPITHLQGAAALRRVAGC